MKFAPLHVYSGYSFLESGLTINKIVSSTIANDYFGCALTDRKVMFGIPSFISQMETNNRKYLVGMEIELDGNLISLYVKNEQGYLNLSKISSAIQKETFTKEFLIEHNEGLIAIIDSNRGEIKNNFLSVTLNEEDLARYVNEINKCFKEFFIGIEIKEREELNHARRVRKFIKTYDYQPVAFPLIRYQKEDDAIVLSICEAIDKDEKLSIKSKKGNEYFMKEENYLRIYTSEELENTVKIVSSSTFSYHQKRGEMLHFPVDDPKSYLKDYCFNSLKEKKLDDKQEYIDRLNYELDVISNMGYDSYFLLVQDYVLFSRNSGILVGLRGSAAGSLVTYLLNIAPLDPIKYNLQFERFLNPSRKTMPDIDIDFMDTRRSEVVKYCRNKYGKERVCNIITYQTILAKQALRDIGRIYDIPTRHIDLLTKTIPNPKNKKSSLRDAYKTSEAFRKIVDSDPYFLEIVSLASKIEGLPRQAGTHAAGIILNNDPIEDAMPISVDLSDNLISQYEMGYLEEQGFLKMDFLGLINLSIVSDCVDLINKNHPGVNLDKFNLPYDDEKIFDVICQNMNMGIFQLESSGMNENIKILKPHTFMDVAALLALYRPGPMDSIPSYAKRKEGKEMVPPMSDAVKKILGPTYGIITYQEQITELAVAMSGMSVADADNFRRAVSKKKADLLESMSKSFIEGAIKNGYSKEEANDYFNRISKFASYGFNKSHAVGYAYLTCQMAYLKAYYPLEFYSSILESSSSISDSKFNDYVSEMKKRNIKMIPPSINSSLTKFSIKDDGILFPLTAIKGISMLNAEKIIEVRKNGEFKDFFDFVLRTFALKLSDNQILSLIDSGAFDEITTSRASLRASLLYAKQFAELNTSMDGVIQLIVSDSPELLKEEDDPMENLEKEYDAIGIMLSSNPLKLKRDYLSSLEVMSLLEATSMANEMRYSRSKPIKIAAILRSKKVINTKSSSQMAFVKLFDETGELEATIFPNLYKDTLQLLEKNNILLIEGRFEKNKESTTFVADKVSLLGE